MTNRKKLILTHIGFWSVYCCMELTKFALISVIDEDLWMEVSTNLLCGIIFFYLMLAFVFPKGISRLRFIRVILRFSLSLLLSITVRYAAFKLLAASIDFSSAVVTNINFFFVSSFDLFLKFGLYALVVWFFQRQAALQQQILEKEIQEERLRRELLETKYAVLQAQINPHFLFNTLHFIHSKALSADDHLIDKTVLLLSDILRHSLQHSSHQELVFVRDEVAQIHRLYELNKLRFNGKYYLQIDETGQQYQKKIPPLVLLTFFENMMKYGVFDDPQYPASVRVTQSEQHLEICTQNKIEHYTTGTQRDRQAIGTRYIRKVLDNYYPKNYTLTQHNDGVFYQVDLKINTL